MESHINNVVKVSSEKIYLQKYGNVYYILRYIFLHARIHPLKHFKKG